MSGTSLSNMSIRSRSLMFVYAHYSRMYRECRINLRVPGVPNKVTGDRFIRLDCISCSRFQSKFIEIMS